MALGLIVSMGNICCHRNYPFPDANVRSLNGPNFVIINSFKASDFQCGKWRAAFYPNKVRLRLLIPREIIELRDLRLCIIEANNNTNTPQDIILMPSLDIHTVSKSKWLDCIWWKVDVPNRKMPITLSPNESILICGFKLIWPFPSNSLAAECKVYGHVGHKDRAFSLWGYTEPISVRVRSLYRDLHNNVLHRKRYAFR